MGTEPPKKGKFEAAEEFATRMAEVRKEARRHWLRRQTIWPNFTIAGEARPRFSRSATRSGSMGAILRQIVQPKSWITVDMAPLRSWRS